MAVAALLVGGLPLRTPAPSASAAPAPVSAAPSPSTSAVPAHHLYSVPLTGPHPAQNLQDPAWLAYDAADNWFYVADPPSTLDGLNASYSYPWVNTSVTVGTDPFGVVVDPITGDVLVTNTGSDNVSVVDPTTNSVVLSVPVGDAPMGIAFDPVTQQILVANNQSNNVTFLSAATYAVTANVAVGHGPVGVAVDYLTGSAYVANSLSSTVSVLNDSSWQVVATVGTGDTPYGVAFDNRSGYVYVTNAGSANVTVIDAGTSQVLTSVPVEAWGTSGSAPLQGIAYDPQDNMLWVGAGQVTAVVIDPANESVAAYISIDPSGVAYDSANGNVCVTNTANRTFECIAFAGDSYTAPTLTFAESGLPTGTTWSVMLVDYYGVATTGTGSTATSRNITFASYWQQVTYQVAAVGADYLASPVSGSINQSGVPVQINIAFSLVAPGTFFWVNFTESGLPTGTSWWVDLGGFGQDSSGLSNDFQLADGTYTYYVLPIDGTQAQSGTVVVNGSATGVSLTFTSPQTYLVTFTEVGLPNGTGWSFDLNGNYYSTTGSLEAAALPNGTYSYLVYTSGNWTPVPSTGSVTVYGAPTDVYVNFSYEAYYFVGFTETGLPAGTLWSVNLSGLSRANLSLSSSSEVLFQEANGTYDWEAGYAVANLSGTLVYYYPAPNNGTVDVVGGSVQVDLVFQSGTPPTLYGVSFHALALPSGSTWSVTFNSQTDQATTAFLNFTAANGTYGYTVSPPSGYLAVPSAGQLVVAGLAVTVDVNLSLAPVSLDYAVTLQESGLPNGTAWSASVNGIANSSISPTIVFDEPNGTYSVNVTAVPGYSVNYSTPVVVHGAALTLAVTFSNSTYPVVLLETGLPSGDLWTATAVDTVSGAQVVGQSTGPTLTLHLLDGTYDLSVAGPSGYTVHLSATEVGVHGTTPAPVQVAFTSPSSSGGTSPLGPFGYLTVVYVLTAVVAGLAAVWGLARYRSERWRSEGEEWVRELRDESRTEPNERTR